MSKQNLHDPNNANEDTARGQQETRWEEVATTNGITTAQILAGRLQSEGIPARAWPEEYVDKALDILADVDNNVDKEDED